MKLCATCKTHPAIRDGRECRECLNRYLYETRPRTSPWVNRARENRLPAWTR